MSAILLFWRYPVGGRLRAGVGVGSLRPKPTTAPDFEDCMRAGFAIRAAANPVFRRERLFTEHAFVADHVARRRRFHCASPHPSIPLPLPTPGGSGSRPLETPRRPAGRSNA